MEQEKQDEGFMSENIESEQNQNKQLLNGQNNPHQGRVQNLNKQDQLEENENISNENREEIDDESEEISSNQNDQESNKKQTMTPQKQSEDNGTSTPQITVHRRSTRYKSYMDLDSNLRSKDQDSALKSSRLRRGTQLSSRKDRRDRTEQGEGTEKPSQEKKRNEFWKFRHKPQDKKIEEESILQTENTVQKMQFNHINMENQEEVLKVSIIKAQEYNQRLLLQKTQMREIFKQQQRISMSSNRDLDSNRNNRFPSDIPIYLYDQYGNQYFSDPNQIKETKGTLEQFIHLNVQHEHNLLYLNDVNRHGGFLNKGILKSKKKRKRRRRDTQPNTSTNLI